MWLRDVIVSVTNGHPPCLPHMQHFHIGLREREQGVPAAAMLRKLLQVTLIDTCVCISVSASSMQATNRITQSAGTALRKLAIVMNVNSVS